MSETSAAFEEALGATEDISDPAKAATIKAAMQSLMLHQGWKMLCEIIAAQAKAREVLLWAPLESTDQLPKMEFMKGERAALDLLVKMPTVIMETAQTTLEVEVYRTKEREEADDGNGE